MRPSEREDQESASGSRPARRSLHEGAFARAMRGGTDDGPPGVHADPAWDRIELALDAERDRQEGGTG